MQFTFNEKHLRRLCEINSFEPPDDGLVFFGLRGCAPMNENQSTDFNSEHRLDVVETNYQTPRCVIGQWKPADKKIACFVGSTVPSISNIQRSVRMRGVGANQLMSGFYNDYTKGFHHNPSHPTGHRAFRQTQPQAIRRTADDNDFDNNDRVEVTNPFDNIHCGWCSGVTSRYDSAGCQVVMGYPKCIRRGALPDTGHWKIFRSNAYDGFPNQSKFTYILFGGNEARRVSLLADGEKSSARLRFGSQGELVKTLQQALKDKEFYDSEPDSKFGRRTLSGVLRFQESVFGPSSDDGIVGPVTAEALGINWVDL